MIKAQTSSRVLIIGHNHRSKFCWKRSSGGISQPLPSQAGFRRRASPSSRTAQVEHLNPASGNCKPSCLLDVVWREIGSGSFFRSTNLYIGNSKITGPPLPPSLTTFKDDALIALDSISDRAGNLLNPTLRLGVTGFPVPARQSSSHRWYTISCTEAASRFWKRSALAVFLPYGLNTAG